jgi:uncharacterized protein YyaL (SSP411 family)
VNWYPWGTEAFARAEKLNKPILLSIGYASCHWCHVMEQESFEDEEIAKYINQHYVAIKVDREERPELDSIYMLTLQAFTGSGGWPITIWMTPQKKSFLARSYVPARDGDRGTKIGFLSMLKSMKVMYEKDYDRIIKTGDETTKLVVNSMQIPVDDRLPEAIFIDQVMEAFKRKFDNQYGGLKGKNKFPSHFPIEIMFRYFHQKNDKVILDMANKTLDNMAKGGLYDQVGGGFHRYSIDEKWLVPHFEKMLYDNAQMIDSYAWGYQISKKPFYRKIVEETYSFLQREMMNKDGAFYSSLDADSRGPTGELVEGHFYLWPYYELQKALTSSELKLFKRYFDVSKKGNYEGKNVLALKEPFKKIHQKNMDKILKNYSYLESMSLLQQ